MNIGVLCMRMLLSMHIARWKSFHSYCSMKFSVKVTDKKQVRLLMIVNNTMYSLMLQHQLFFLIILTWRLNSTDLVILFHQYAN
jgi:hypothetical protein